MPQTRRRSSGWQAAAGRRGGAGGCGAAAVAARGRGRFSPRAAPRAPGRSLTRCPRAPREGFVSRLLLFFPSPHKESPSLRQSIRPLYPGGRRALGLRGRCRSGWAGGHYVLGATLSCWEKRGRQVPGERHGPDGTALCLLPARLRPHDKVRWGGRRRKEQSSGLSRFGSRFSESLWCSPRGVGRGYGSETSLCFSTLTSCRSVNETVRQYVGSLSIFIQPLQKTEMRCTVKYHSRCRDRVADKEIPLC